MGTKEKYMNHQFSSVVSAYQDVKKRLEEFEGKSSKVNDKVAKLTNELAELTDKLEEIKETFESKDSVINDTSPLVRTKAALQQIKQESCAFDLRIGVVSHLLLAARVSATHHRRASHAHKSKQRHSKSKAVEDSVLSDD
jgi:predicted nuclease with TOPRIM domain